ncbi:MAG: hypothetical protein H6662_05095 [Ardenticatenaceae bacterium]|nr:hypothetical protein [Anaerolineales bacterium]MCB8920943.1 hypothetical protein [Ardenticatenaceae bacterium]
MEEEIDLRPYIETLIKNWKGIIGTGLIATIVAFGISFLLPPTYEATSLVAITETRQNIQFDPRIQTEEDQQPLQAFPQLAMSDELLQQLFEQLALPQTDVESVQELSKLLEAQSGADPSLIQLTADYKEAEMATQIANLWAELFVEWANEIYRDSNGEQLAFYENQLAGAETDLATTEQALVDFQLRNRSSIVENRLSALNQVEAQYLADQKQITFLLQDLTGLQTQLALQNSTDVTWADQLTVLNLQLQAFGAQGDGGVQFQVGSGTDLTSASRREQQAYLDGLQATLETRLDEIELNLIELEPEILALQQEKQVLLVEANRLQRNVSVAEETYTTLARKVDEERITSQDVMNSLRLASNSVVPDEPVSPHRSIIALVSGFLGGSLMIFALLGREWWSVSEEVTSAS